jgi:glycosyltransferase involved in cell wall biosynthesis
MMRKAPVMYVTIPCYNEEACLKITYKELGKKLEAMVKAKSIAAGYKIVFVDDGSKDKTWEIIEELSEKNKNVIGLKLSRNRGHQNALLSGLEYSSNHAEVIVSMDADLQDDINALDGFIEEYRKGAEIVYGVRSERKKDSFFKRFTAQSFYRLMKWMGAETVYNHADYRLMSQRALKELLEYGERNLFLRGIVPLIGFKTAVVKFSRNERVAGESKYPLKKMLALAWDGITSFSVKPIRVMLFLGLIILLVSLGIMIYSFIVKLCGQAVDGWTFTICSIWLLGGLQMLMLGIIGEYVGKIYAEVKHRPRYIIAEFLHEEK